MESDRFIAVRETTAQGGQVIIIDTSSPGEPMRFPVRADAAVMHPSEKILALKGEPHTTKEGEQRPAHPSPAPPSAHLSTLTRMATHLTRLFQLESMFARRVPRRPFLLAARARSTAAMLGELLRESSSSRWRAA